MAEWTPIQGMRDYGRVLGRKMAFCTIGWLIAYFLSQPFRPAESASLNVLALFSPMIGAIAGLIIGWYVATDAVEDSGFSGMTLWVILVIASWLPMAVIEGIMLLVWKPMGFGGWMMLMSAMILAMATAVWNASAQE